MSSVVEVHRFSTGHRDRIVISPEHDGVYVYVFQRGNAAEPEYDYRLDSVAGAKRFCEASWNVSLEEWEPSTEDMGVASSLARGRRKEDGDDAWELARDVGAQATGCVKPSLFVSVFMIVLF